MDEFPKWRSCSCTRDLRAHSPLLQPFSFLCTIYRLGEGRDATMLGGKLARTSLNRKQKYGTNPREPPPLTPETPPNPPRPQNLHFFIFYGGFRPREVSRWIRTAFFMQIHTFGPQNLNSGPQIIQILSKIGSSRPSRGSWSPSWAAHGPEDGSGLVWGGPHALKYCK